MAPTTIKSLSLTGNPSTPSRTAPPTKYTCMDNPYKDEKIKYSNNFPKIQ
ncbi:hypothetical protein AO383_1211 [Moraxella catarrhalis]|nr:hypothetical protein AO383_1211 [Moraxella catarrhalis]